MHRLLSLLFPLSTLLSLTLTLSAQKAPNYTKRLSGIDKELQQVLKDQQMAGFSVAVVQGDKVIYSKGFGYRDLENKKPVTSNTLFGIGSCTKSFTCGMIGQLEKEGLLKLDNPARSYLPSLTFKHDYLNTGVTVRDMMCHRTGLARFDFSWYIFNSVNRDSLLDRVKYMEPNEALRSKWQYNNFMFLAQGMIAEKLTGKTWEQNIKERFFDPLGMERANTSITALAADADASFPYKTDIDGNIEKTEFYNISGMGPAGSINASANDMAKWLSLWIMGGKYKGNELLPSGFVSQAITSQSVIAGGFPVKEVPDVQFSNYGFGWMLHSYRGHYLVEHGGNIDGFSAMSAFYPTDSIGIVILTNQDGSLATRTIRNLLSDRLLGLSHVAWDEKAKTAISEEHAAIRKAMSAVDSVQVKDTKPSHALAAYSGWYSNPAYGEMNIVAYNDSLFITVGNDRGWLKHYHYDVFTMKNIAKDGSVTDGGALQLIFNTSANGKIEAFTVQLDEPSGLTTFAKSEKAVKLKTGELDKYLGEYLLEGVTIKIYTKGEVLWITVPGQPDYETVSVGDNVFNLTAAKGYSVKFDLGAENKATAVTFVQPNGNFKAMRSAKAK
ncbi:MAG: serine hydrolase [Bacteroidota bacterium]